MIKLTAEKEVMYLCQLFDKIEGSIYWKNLSYQYVMCNEYMLNMAGLKKEEIIGITDYCLPWKKEANKIREIDELVIFQKNY